MPRLDPGSDLLGGVNPDAAFASKLPAGGFGPVQVRLSERADFGRMALENFGTVARLTGANLAISYGVPSFHFDSFVSMMREWPRVRISGALELAARTGEIAEVLRGWSVDLGGFTSVPIVGWVVALLKGLYDGVVGFDGLMKALAAPKVSAAFVYVKEEDELAVQRMMALVGSPDWTRVFMPPVYPLSGFTERNIAWSGDKPQGRRIEPVVGAAEMESGALEGYGVVPGLPLLEHVWQFANGDPPSKLQGGGGLYPSALQYGQLLWSMVMKPSPQMFSIDAERIMTAWSDWYGLLLESPANKRMRSYAGRWWDADIDQLGGHRFDPYTPDSVPAKYAANRSIGSLVEYIVGELWYERLRPTLSTVLCAYVHPDAPGLRWSKGATPMRQYHHNLRKLLLTHPARREVELDMIPDAEYRNAMAQAKLSIADDFVAPGWHTLEGAPSVLDEPIDLPPAPGPALPASGEGGGLGGALLVGGGILGSLWLGSRLLRARRGRLRA